MIYTLTVCIIAIYELDDISVTIRIDTYRYSMY